MDKRFLRAYIQPGPLRMLGRRLYPWCIKYRVRLMAFNSPFVTGERGVTPADLVFACQVCAEEPLGDIGLIDQFRIMRLSADTERFERYVQAFVDYTNVSCWPKFWEQNNKKVSGRGVPWPITVVSGLIANGIPEQRAWEMPECQAIWLNTAMAISKGADVSVMSPEEEAFMEQQEAKDKAVADPAKVDP